MAIFQISVNPTVDDVEDILAKAAPNVVTGMIFISPSRITLTLSDQVQISAGFVTKAPLGPALKPITPLKPRPR
jgi:hypothetical protein